MYWHQLSNALKRLAMCRVSFIPDPDQSFYYVGDHRNGQDGLAPIVLR
jgi:hypothetical protein